MLVNRRRLVPLALVCAMAAGITTACRIGGIPHSDSPPADLVLLSVLGWSSQSAVLVGWIERIERTGEPRTLCAHAGLYSVSVDGTISRWHHGPGVCEALAAADHLSLSRDRSKLLYAAKHNGSIHVYNLRTGRDTVVAQDCLPITSAPAWSPHGTSIAFSANCSHPQERAQIHLMRDDGTGRRDFGVSEMADQEDQPAWSVDGRRLVITSGSSIRSSMLVTLDTATGVRRGLVRGYGASWSETSDWIAFFRLANSSGSRPSIWLVRPDGTGEHPVIDPEASEDSRWLSDPAVWSPFDNQFAVARENEVWIGGPGRPMHRVFIARP